MDSVKKKKTWCMDEKKKKIKFKIVNAEEK